MAYDRSNVFARILRHEAPAHRVFEDDRTLAFLDIRPVVEGHTLVVPKAEAVDLFDLDPEMAAATIRTTQRVARAVDAAFRPAGILIAQLNRAGAGQTVFHLHFHVVPRHHGLDMNIHSRAQADAAVLEAHAERIRARIG